MSLPVEIIFLYFTFPFLQTLYIHEQTHAFQCHSSKRLLPSDQNVDKTKFIRWSLSRSRFTDNYQFCFTVFSIYFSINPHATNQAIAIHFLYFTLKNKYTHPIWHGYFIYCSCHLIENRESGRGNTVFSDNFLCQIKTIFFLIPQYWQSSTCNDHHKLVLLVLGQCFNVSKTRIKFDMNKKQYLNHT